MELKEIRNFLGLTQKELACRLKLAQGTISSIEAGQRKLTDRLLSQICLTFNLSDEWVRTGKGEPYKNVALNDSFLNELVKAYEGMTEGQKESFKSFLVTFGILGKEKKEVSDEVI